MHCAPHTFPQPWSVSSAALPVRAGRLHWVPAPPASPFTGKKSPPLSGRPTRIVPSLCHGSRPLEISWLVTRLIYISSAGQWVAQFLHLGQAVAPIVVPWRPLGCRPRPRKDSDQSSSECGRGQCRSGRRWRRRRHHQRGHQTTNSTYSAQHPSGTSKLFIKTRQMKIRFHQQ